MKSSTISVALYFTIISLTDMIRSKASNSDGFVYGSVIFRVVSTFNSNSKIVGAVDEGIYCRTGVGDS